MSRIVPLLIAASLALAACSSSPSCDKPSPYQKAVPGKRVEPLAGMDPLPPEQEMTIPQASPDAPQPPGDCVDSPPTLRTGGDDG